MTVRLTKNQKIRILNSQDIATIMQEVLQREKKIDRIKEHLWLVALDPENRIMMIELISLGSNKHTIAEPMEVFSFALQKHAAKIILVHNHPSGSVRPSLGDRGLTDQMMAIGKFLKLPVTDHIIISEDAYFSFVDSGLYREIEESTLYDLSFTRIHKLLEEIEEEKSNTKLKVYAAEQKMKEVTEKAQKYEIARKAKLKGLGSAEISELTGLTSEELAGLE
jgi:DNA repair protein RadC